MASPPVLLQATGIERLVCSVAAEVGDLIGHDGSSFVKADADGRIPASFMAMQNAAAGDTINVCSGGVLFDVDAPYTAGAEQYLSATAGAHTATIPAVSTTLTVLQRIGKALTTTVMAFDLRAIGPTIMRGQVTYDPASLAATTARSDTVSLTGLLTTDIVRGFCAPVVTGTGWNTGLIIQGFDVSAADTLRIRLQNATAGALDGASTTLDVYVERF